MDLFQIFIENLAELGYLGALLAGFLGSSTLFFSIFPSFVVIPIIGSAIDWEKRIKKYGVIVIFIFAATPLTPDDILWIPLGIMGYPKLRALIAAILGKITLNLLYAYTGFFGMELLM